MELVGRWIEAAGDCVPETLVLLSHSEPLGKVRNQTELQKHSTSGKIDFFLRFFVEFERFFAVGGPESCPYSYFRRRTPHHDPVDPEDAITVSDLLFQNKKNKDSANFAPSVSVNDWQTSVTLLTLSRFVSGPGCPASNWY